MYIYIYIYIYIERERERESERERERERILQKVVDNDSGMLEVVKRNVLGQNLENPHMQC